MRILGLQTNTGTADLLVHQRAAVVAEASGFIAETVLLAAPGDFKEVPLLGADARSMLAANRDPFWPGNTKKCCVLSGSMLPQ
jgi:hypothetical protein